MTLTNGSVSRPVFEDPSQPPENLRPWIKDVALLSDWEHLPELHEQILSDESGSEEENISFWPLKTFLRSRRSGQNMKTDGSLGYRARAKTVGKGVQGPLQDCPTTRAIQAKNMNCCSGSATSRGIHEGTESVHFVLEEVW